MPNITSNSSRWYIPIEPTDIWYWLIRGIIAILTITGNGLVIYFVVSKRRLRVTNNWFVLSLAVADFCVGLFTTPSGLACTFYYRCDWRLQVTFYNFLLFASTLNLWAMAIDRYIGIVHSLRYTSLMTASRVFGMIATAWGTSVIASFARLIWWLNDSISGKNIDKYYRVVMDLLFGFFSCVALLFIYLRILFISRKLASQAATQVNDVNYNQSHGHDRELPSGSKRRYRQARRNASARILGSVVLLFVLCYSLSIYISFCLNFKLRPVNLIVASISLLLVHFNSCVNFAVYAFMKSDIRTELKRLFRLGNPVEFSHSGQFSLNLAGNTSATY